jgi:hypothetical protein
MEVFVVSVATFLDKKVCDEGPVHLTRDVEVFSEALKATNFLAKFIARKLEENYRPEWKMSKPYSKWFGADDKIADHNKKNFYLMNSAGRYFGKGIHIEKWIDWTLKKYEVDSNQTIEDELADRVASLNDKLSNYKVLKDAFNDDKKEMDNLKEEIDAEREQVKIFGQSVHKEFDIEKIKCDSDDEENDSDDNSDNTSVDSDDEKCDSECDSDCDTECPKCHGLVPVSMKTVRERHEKENKEKIEKMKKYCKKLRDLGTIDMKTEICETLKDKNKNVC